MTRTRKVLLGLGILAAGIIVFMMLVSTRPEPARTDAPPAAPRVETVVVTAGDAQVTVTATGTVLAKQDVAITSEVGGRIESVSDDFVPGGRVAKGDLLVALDYERFSLAVSRAQAQLAQARSELALERGRVDVAEREWKLFNDDEAGAGALARREPQLAAARANVQSAEANLRSARLDLERSRITAPFDGVVTAESVDVGQVINPGQTIGRLVGSDVFWVRANVPVDRLRWITMPDAKGNGGARATITQATAEAAAPRGGRVVRLLGDLEAESRQARLLIEVPRPLSGDTPLLVGAFVDVAIDGRGLTDVIAVPREAMIGRDQLWVVTDENALSRRTVDVAWRGQDTVYVRAGTGLDDGDTVLMTRLPVATDGMAVRLFDDDRAGDDEIGDREGSAP